MEKVTVNAKSPTVEEFQKEISSLKAELDKAIKEKEMYNTLYKCSVDRFEKLKNIYSAVKSIINLGE